MSNREERKPALKNIVEVVAALGVLIGGLYAAASFVDNRVKQALDDPRILSEIARQVRPAVIFDSDGRILADQGGLKFIESVSVNRNDAGALERIEVLPVDYLAVAPLLESIDEGGWVFTAERGKGTLWTYSLRSEVILDTGVKNPRFRLEVLR